jgi:hypothetical protein
LVAVVLVAAGAAWFLFLRFTPEKAVADYLADARAGDEPKARALLTPDTLQGIDQLEVQVSQMTGGGVPRIGASGLIRVSSLTIISDAKIEIGKANVNGETATVTVATVQKEPSYSSTEIRCEKIKGQWKLDLSQDLMGTRRMMMGRPSWAQQVAMQFPPVASAPAPPTAAPNAGAGARD